MTGTADFGKKLSALRAKGGLSQEALAEKLNVSKQAIQKWEAGRSYPSLDNLLALAEYADVSLDYLLGLTDRREIEEMRTADGPKPSYRKQPQWEAFYKQLPIEYRECVDSGKDVQSYAGVLTEIHKLPDGALKAALADELYLALEQLPQREDYPYVEPSDYETICAQRELKNATYPKQTSEKLTDRVKGAWFGRICGCLLGKPLEGIRRRELYPLLKATGNFPLHRYLNRDDLAACEGLSITFPIRQRLYEKGVLPGMPSDDDTNYNILAYLLIKRFGRDFTPDQVAQLWLDAQPKNAYCTAERVAFCNFIKGYFPPESAQFQNPYREWIGAQIRGDLFGWINPGDPGTAAEYAWRDASISHTKNGIYGEMWIAATLAAACGGAEIPQALAIGLSAIPKRSRLYEALENVIAFYASGRTSAEFFEDFHTRWNENDGYDWCHTISNAEIVTAALLWGEGDYARSICMAVEQGFDTDCNGATVGSVIGAVKGYGSLPKEWTRVISDTLFSTIFGYGKVSVSAMAEETVKLIR